jgi:pimeloyl-ACP methyl ester carboxylesterase
MIDTSRLIYLHGLESDSTSGKARLFREWFPGMLTPDFKGAFEERMSQLLPILSDKTDWSLIGSSFGGLMGTVFTCQHPTQVRKLVLLAPALLCDTDGKFLDPTTGEYLVYLNSQGYNLQPVAIPVSVVHGLQDDVVPLEPVRKIAQMLFTDLTYHIVEDDHRLGKSVHELDWKNILG